MPFVPEATLSLGAGGDLPGPGEDDPGAGSLDVTFVAAGASDRSSRSLPVMPGRTRPMFKLPPDDPQ
jgi:hypothetical protein